MKNLLSIMLALLTLAAMVQGETYVQGNIGNAVWTQAGSPYIVTGNITAGTLTVNAGVNVLISSYCHIFVSSTLEINGTETDSVYFSPRTTEWGYLSAGTNGGPHQVRYTVFEGANDVSEAVLQPYSGDFLIEHCTFRNNQKAVEPAFGGYHLTSVVIKYCDFYSNHTQLTYTDLVTFSMYESLIIDQCRFFDNNTDVLIRVSRSSAYGVSTVISQCQFYNNACNAVADAEYVTISNSVFYQPCTPGRPIFQGEYWTIPDNQYCYVQNCIFWNCDSIASHPLQYQIEYSDLDLPYPGTGNISADPLFVDPDSGNFNLDPGSPCINSGNPAGWWYEPDGSRADMGCFGGSGFVPFPLKLEFPPLPPGESYTLPFYFYNLNNQPMQIGSVYFTSPRNLAYALQSPLPIPAYGRAKYYITFTYPGHEFNSQFVINSPQFYHPSDTAAVPIHSTAETFMPISGVWTQQNSPYNITQNLVVPDGQQLTIESGVVVRFDPAVVLKVQGNLQASGTSAGRIYLNDNGGDNWGTIWFDAADGNNILNYVSLQEADGSPLTFGKGGGIHANSTQLTITGCYIELYYDDALCQYGGGIYAENCPTISITNSTFSHCNAPIEGGALYLNLCPEVIIDSCLFEYNTASIRGGGIYSKRSNISLDSCWFDYSGITAPEVPGIGMFLDSLSEATVNRTIFTQNYVSSLPGLLSLTNNSHLVIDHSDIYFIVTSQAVAIQLNDANSTVHVNNTIFRQTPTIFSAPNPLNAQMTYSIAQQAWPGIGNLVGDPLLSQNYELTINSPCIDAGDPNFALDPDSTRSDMGALYYNQNGPGGPIIGPVFGVWTPDHGPYIIAGDINVPAGDTLTILPGSSVLYNGNWDFDVYGTLLVLGTAQDSVNFSALSSYPPCALSIHFHSNQSESRLEFGNFSNAGLSMGPSPTIVRHCKLNAGIYGENSAAANLVEDCYTTSNIHGGSNWTIRRNEVHHSVSFNYEYFDAQAWAILNASGSFTENTIWVYASNSEGYATAIGFNNCDGEIAHNTVYATGTQYKAGIVQCEGSIHHNSIQAGTEGISDCTGEIFNNTIIGADYGFYFTSPHSPVKNNIVYNCDVGFRGQFDVQYSCVFNCPTPFSQGATQGIGTILRDPLLINTWFLSPTSPCIDAGDPAPLYNDPDGTRNDMGANYYEQNLTGLYINTTPVAPPVVIPANGGSFPYYIHVMNPTALPQTVQVWNKARNTNGASLMIFGPITRTLSAGANPTRILTQYIAGYLLAGTQIIISYVGTYPNTIADSSFFNITKSAVADGGPWIAECYGTGDLFDEFTSRVEVIPEEYSLKQNFPNPFNASTTFQFDLPQAGKVRLAVYDVTGREVAVLVDGYREAGVHKLTFNAMGLASGIYIARLTIGGSSGSGPEGMQSQTTPTTMVQKMVLLK